VFNVLIEISSKDEAAARVPTKRDPKRPAKHLPCPNSFLPMPSIRHDAKEFAESKVGEQTSGYTYIHRADKGEHPERQGEMRAQIRSLKRRMCLRERKAERERKREREGAGREGEEEGEGERE
jgi:hypothetical protein